MAAALIVLRMSLRGPLGAVAISGQRDEWCGAKRLLRRFAPRNDRGRKCGFPSVFPISASSLPGTAILRPLVRFHLDDGRD